MGTRLVGRPSKTDLRYYVQRELVLILRNYNLKGGSANREVSQGIQKGKYPNNRADRSPDTKLGNGKGGTQRESVLLTIGTTNTMCQCQRGHMGLGDSDL